MEHRRQLGGGQLCRFGEEAAREHLEREVARRLREIDALQEGFGVDVVEPLVDVGHRHRRQRCGGPGIDARQVAKPKRGAAQRERQRVPRRGAGQPAEAVAAAGAVDQRIVVDGHQHPQLRIDPAQQGPQVVVLAKEGVKPAIHRQLGAVQMFGPAAHPTAEVVLALPRGPRRPRVRRARLRRPGRRSRRRRRRRAAATTARCSRAIPVVPGERGGGGQSSRRFPQEQDGRRCVPSRAWFRCAPRRIRRRACGAETARPRRRSGRCATDAGTAWCHGYATSRRG